jgi:lipopolysaccharide/colanic/teichoic acid biosynthesis glycosyltransferase
VKRGFDLVMAFAGLVLLLPLFATVGLLIKMGSPGPVFFRQQRMGKGFKPFFIYKFRTMIVESSQNRQVPLTVGGDPRITRIGRWLRKTKIDELPQLINVLGGEMSLVGPRPEVPQFVELFRTDYEEILAVRPGITDLASLKYRDESSLLGKTEHPEEEYQRHVLPDKISLAKDYLRCSSFFFDLRLIVKTLFKLFEHTSELEQRRGLRSRRLHERH